jgi:hypothetical protein
VTLDEQRDLIRDRYRNFFSPEDAARHPLYASLCTTVEHDDALVDILLDTPQEQARPNLVLAALHDLSLEDPSSELAQHYPTAVHFAACGQTADSDAVDPIPSTLPDPGAAEDILSWIGRNRDLVISRMAGRSTQTNEIGRNAVLAAGVAFAVQGQEVALVDLGCSAGLNLLVDRYRIERSDGHSMGDEQSTIVISSQVSGAPMPSEHAPIAWRAGIDLDPPDLEDDVAVRWLLACQWPDDVARFERSRRAMGLWRSSSDRPPVIAGGAIESIEALIDQIPEELLVVVQHSWVVTYMTTEAQQELAAILRRVMSRRPLAWLSFEHPRLVPGLDHPRPTNGRIPGSTTLVLEDPAQGARVIAQAHPHGTWIRWGD